MHDHILFKLEIQRCMHLWTTDTLLQLHLETLLIVLVLIIYWICFKGSYTHIQFCKFNDMFDL